VNSQDSKASDKFESIRLSQKKQTIEIPEFVPGGINRGTRNVRAIKIMIENAKNIETFDMTQLEPETNHKLFGSVTVK
jgi:hypothetical protein